MPTRMYKNIAFSDERLDIIRRANQLVKDYAAQGYALTLRQLYYQFVARDWFPPSWADKETGSTNNERSYKKLGDVLSDARMAGRLDWLSIEDRTRSVEGNSHWTSPAEIVKACAAQYQIDKWEDQPYRVEVWVEKDALEGVVEKVARDVDVSFFSCRGYASMTSVWNAGQRLLGHCLDGQLPVILHLGDHDPSGIDMSRDIQERVALFMDGNGHKLMFERIALNWDQVQQYKPPPNPAKVTDSRFKAYVDRYGPNCWELDALDPAVIDALIRRKVSEYCDGLKFDLRRRDEDEQRKRLVKIASAV